MENHYLGKFDENGKAESFLLEGIHYKTAEEKAAKIKEKFDKVCQSHPIKADVESEKELVEIVDKAVDEIGRPIVEK